MVRNPLNLCLLIVTSTALHPWRMRATVRLWHATMVEPAAVEALAVKHDLMEQSIISGGILYDYRPNNSVLR